MTTKTSTKTSTKSYSYTQGKRISFAKRTDLVAVSFQLPASAETIKAFEQANRAVIQPSSEFLEMQGGNLRIYRIGPADGLNTEMLANSLRHQQEVIKVSDVYVYVNARGQGLVLIDDLVAKVKPTARQIVLPFHTRETYTS